MGARPYVRPYGDLVSPDCSRPKQREIALRSDLLCYFPKGFSVVQVLRNPLILII